MSRGESSKRARLGKEPMMEERPGFDSRIFCSKAAADRFEKLRVRRIVEDRGIDLDVCTFEFVRRIIVAHDWKKFVHPVSYRNVPAELIKEFYANLSVVNNLSDVPVRRRLVPFNPTSINIFLGTPRREQCFYKAALTNSSIPIERIIDVTCLDGTQWEHKRDVTKIRVARSKLKPEVKTVFHFVIHSLLPQHKQSEVYYKHLLLLYCIMCNEKIDVGEIIYRLAWDVSRSGASLGLPFPSLIYIMCEKSKVGGYSAEPVSKCQKPISVVNVAQYFSQSGVDPPFCPALDGAPPQRAVPPQTTAASSSRPRQFSERRSKRNEDRAAKPRAKPMRLSLTKTMKKISKYCKFLGKQILTLRKQQEPDLDTTGFEVELESEETDTDEEVPVPPAQGDIDMRIDDSAVDSHMQMHREFDGNASSSEDDEEDSGDSEGEDDEDDEEF